MYKIKKQLIIYKGIIISCILLFVSFGALFYGIFPSYNSGKIFYNENKTLSEDIKKIKARLDVLNSYTNQELDRIMNLLISAVPYEKDIPRMITNTEKIIVDNGVTEISMSIDSPGSVSTKSGQIGPVNDKNLTKNMITMDLSISGPKEAIVNFLNKAVTIRKLMNISEANFAINPESDVIAANLQIHTYFAPLPEVMGKPTDKLEQITTSEMDMINELEQYEEIQTDIIDFSNYGFSKENPFAPFDYEDELQNATQSGGNL